MISLPLLSSRANASAAWLLIPALSSTSNSYSNIRSRHSVNFPLASVRLRLVSTHHDLYEWWNYDSPNKSLITIQQKKQSSTCHLLYRSSARTPSVSLTSWWVAFSSHLVVLASRPNQIAYRLHPCQRSSVHSCCVKRVLVLTLAYHVQSMMRSAPLAKGCRKSFFAYFSFFLSRASMPAKLVTECQYTLHEPKNYFT